MYWACATVTFTSFTPLIPPFAFCLVVLGTHTQAWACGASTCLPRSYTPVILHPSLNRQTRLRRMLKKMCVFRWVTLGRDPTYVCTGTYTCIQMCTPVSWAMKQTLIESKAHSDAARLSVAVHGPKSLKRTHGCWSHWPTKWHARCTKLKCLRIFIPQFYSILGELASTIHMSSSRHCDQGQALELPGHIWYQLGGKSLVPRNCASSILGSLFL